MANKYTRKGQQDAPPLEDEFVSISGRIFDALLPHARNIAIGAGGIVVLALVGWIVSGMRTSSREAATEMFGHALMVYEAELLPEDAKDKDAAKSDDDVQRYKTSRERGEAVLAELDKLQKAYGGSSVNEQAQALRAGVLYDLGRLDESKAAAQKFIGEAGKNNPVVVLAREDEALALEQQGKLDDALRVYKDLEDKGGDFFIDQARYDQARVLVKKGDAGGAKVLYKKILEKSATGSLHEEVQSRLAALGG